MGESAGSALERTNVGLNHRGYRVASIVSDQWSSARRPLSSLTLKILLAMLGALAFLSTARAEAPSSVEVRLWQSATVAEEWHVTVRPEGGRWSDTVPIPPTHYDGYSTVAGFDVQI